MVAKSRRILVVCGLVAAAISLVAIGVRVRYHPFQWSCTSEGKIPDPQREAITRVALELVGRATGTDPSSAYALFAARCPRRRPRRTSLNSHWAVGATSKRYSVARAPGRSANPAQNR